MSTRPEGPAYSAPIHSPMKLGPRSRNVIEIGSATSVAIAPTFSTIRSSSAPAPSPSSALARGVSV